MSTIGMVARCSLLATSALAMLGGCGQVIGEGDGSAVGRPAGGGSSSGSAATAGVRMQAGRWESRIEVVEADAPRLPPGMTAPGVQPITTRFCLTPQQVANPNAETLVGNRVTTGCANENHRFAGGRISGAIVCDFGGGRRMRTTIEGQYAATRYDMVMRIRSGTDGASTDSEVRVTARRVGDCTAG